MEIPVVVIGHVDHGKSTLIGRLLYDSHRIPLERMEELQHFVEESRIRFEFAYFLDALEEEIQQERTIDTVRVCFQGKHTYRIADVPGHREFVGNMLTGASDARIAVLVLSGPNGPEAQTMQHLFLCKLLGVEHLVVALNKMDRIDFDCALFEEAKITAHRLLTEFGFSHPVVVPVVATDGDNVCRPSSRMPWYCGPTLLEALDSIELGTTVGALRFAIQDSYDVNGSPLAVGRIESGTMLAGQTLTFPLSKATSSVESIEVYGEKRNSAHEGDCVGIRFAHHLQRGDVGGPPEDPPRFVTQGIAEIVVLDRSLGPGDHFELGGPVGEVAALVTAIESPVDATNGNPLPKDPTRLLTHQAGLVNFNCQLTCLEPFQRIRSLGRIVVTRRGTLVGFGIVR